MPGTAQHAGHTLEIADSLFWVHRRSQPAPSSWPATPLYLVPAARATAAPAARAPDQPLAYRHRMRGYTQDKDAYLKRLRRVEGQVRGLQRMVEQDVYCIDVLTQVAAVTRALQAVALGLLEDHLGHCVTSAIEEGGPDAQAKVHEAAEAISRLVRS